MAHHLPVILKEDLGEDWDLEGGGGFGQVFKVMHKVRGVHVAVKVLKKDASSVFEKAESWSSIFEEAKFMALSSITHVLAVYEIYKGPEGERGLVTEYMKVGSIESLWEKLSGPPPWPLAFRLVHQIALAMFFIHNKEIVHRDLKPSNILLDKDLNAKVADFGLSVKPFSAKGHNDDPFTGSQGTWRYKPPEAFNASYKPSRSFDVYSFGILVWAIFSGEEPYPAASPRLLKLNDFKDRPDCKDLQRLKDDENKEIKGITELVELMEKCWNSDPNKRPTFIGIENMKFTGIPKTTEELSERHSRDIRWAVPQVWDKMASLKSSNEHPEAQPIDSVDSGVNMKVKQVSSDGDSRKTKTSDNKGLDVVEVEQVSSDSNSNKTMTIDEKANFVKRHEAAIIQGVNHAVAIADELGDMVHRETYNKINNETTVSQGKVRLLYKIATTRRVKAALYDALKKHERDLMQELEEKDSKAGPK